jgi:putative phage-type endonuclease
MSNYKGNRVELTQGSQEWLTWRNDGIGGSEAAALAGSSPYIDAYELWQRKLGKLPDIVPNEAMIRGHKLEPEARELFELENGLSMPAGCFIHPEYDFVRASLDGISADENIILEIKCPGLTTHREALAGKIKPYYFTQMQHQMLVTGAELCYYFSYTDLPDIQSHILIEVPRDEEYIQRLLQREQDFWPYVLNKVEPDMSRFAAKDAGSLNGDIRTDPAFKNALQELITANKVLSDAKSQYAARAERVAQLMQKKKQVKVSSEGHLIERVYSGDKWVTKIEEME